MIISSLNQLSLDIMATTGIAVGWDLQRTGGGKHYNSASKVQTSLQN